MDRPLPDGKLVRDEIPRLIAQHGAKPQTRILTAAEFQLELQRKLHEEVAEYAASGQADELADILEVVYALAATQGISQAELEQRRLDKHRERGGFIKRIYLVSVKPPGEEP